MDSIARDDRERAFLEQAGLFIQEALKGLAYKKILEIPDFTKSLAHPLSPVIIADYRKISPDEKSSIVSAYYGPLGVAHFVVLNPRDRGDKSHPLLDVAEQLKDVLPLGFPVDHPMEGHAEAVSRFGPPDGTLKIYDLETRDGKTGYREQAETSEMFDAHNDGLGYGGAVESVIFYTDSPALWGGYTYFQNVVALSLCLAKNDPDAFTSLFLPDAITAVRPRGKGAIKVTTPALFMNENSSPQCFFRITTGEYQITWRSGCAALERAANFLNNYCRPFAPASTFVHFDRQGVGCVVRNGWVVHGRTRFFDSPDRTQQRVLARKWFMTAPQHARYKHVPGMHLMKEFAEIYPERFGSEFLEGEWNYDFATGQNIKRK